MKPIDRFTIGQWPTVKKFNSITKVTNNFAGLNGDQFITVRQNGAGASINLNLNYLRQFFGSTTITSSSQITFSKYLVVEAPVFPTAGDTTGQAYYRLRLDSESYDDWAADYTGGYSIGDKVTHPSTGRLYESLVNANEAELSDTESWNLLTEIQVTSIWGYTDSIFNFVPVIQTGAKVWVFTYGEAYYILGTFSLVGDADTRNIIMRTDDNGDYVLQAVFA